MINTPPPKCPKCGLSYYVDDSGKCHRCGSKGLNEDPCRPLPYPLRSADELAGCLIKHGLLDESAWHDPEGWDGGTDQDRVYKMFNTIRAENKL